MDLTEAKEIYYRMKMIRATEEKIAEKYSEWKMRCPTHLSTGQEAVASVVGTLLQKDDFAVSTHRAHAHYLGKGGSLKRMIAEIYGKSAGCSGGKGGSMHLVDLSAGFMGSTAIVANSIPVGVGLGLSIKLKDDSQVSCVYFGDAAVEEGVFYEAVNFAVLKKLPVLFVCENNLYSVYSPLSVRQPEGRKIYEMVRGIGIYSQYGNGNDPYEIYTITKKALEYIHAGNGPVFLEFSTYRWREHCGPNYDNSIGYRSEEEFLAWKERDPIILFEKKIKEDYENLKSDFEIIEKKIQSEIEDAFEFAESSPFPEHEEAYMKLFKE